jgi:hypothetical protein
MGMRILYILSQEKNNEIIISKVIKIGISRPSIPNRGRREV